MGIVFMLNYIEICDEVLLIFSVALSLIAERVLLKMGMLGIQVSSMAGAFSEEKLSSLNIFTSFSPPFSKKKGSNMSSLDLYQI